MIAALRHFVAHLRLHFQLILSGIFLWAFLLAGGVPDARAVFAFLVLHVLLYGGTTAFNAYYDQDQGPVTGLRAPPPAGRLCLWGGLGFMAVGAVAAFFVSIDFGLVYVVIALLSIAYSHPRVRLKKGPASSLLTVAVGQGGLGFMAGAAVAVRSGLPPPSVALVAGGLAATLLVTGLYPLTQIFQIADDLKRGDVTFAARFGARGVFRAALACFVLALVAAAPAALAVFAPVETALLFTALAALCVALVVWSRRYDGTQVLANHDRVLGVALVTSACFDILVVRHLAARIT